MRRRYRKKPDRFVTAVQVDLQTEGFSYEKWGSTQHCKPGDWLVNNNGDVYTVDRESFDNTYRKVSPGVYFKDAVVFAEVARHPGSVPTKEGSSAYQAGDYIVSNDSEGSDTYAVKKATFEQLYELLKEP